MSYTGTKYIDLPYLVKGMDVSFSGILTFIEKLALTQPALVQTAQPQPTNTQPPHTQAATGLPVADNVRTPSTAVSAGLDETECGSEPAMKKLAVEAHTPTATSTSALPTTAIAVAATSNTVGSSSSSSSSTSSSSVMSAAESFKADLCYSLQETMFAMLVMRIHILQLHTYHICIHAMQT